ncbi:hypothetical protein EEL30_05315 [Brevibacillus laterosporus]|uniref:Uncharacterized protein n=1 Tax=Brevibacillus laterosporus TaxID=1465 RepID=A0A518V4B6_BRELA|nr:hypothetical protein EEL30_05315 [Brevibacillus laterosporus]
MGEEMKDSFLNGIKYKYDRSVSLDFYRFPNTNTLLLSLKNIQDLLIHPLLSSIKIESDFGTIRLNNFDTLEQIIDESNAIFSIEVHFDSLSENQAILIDFKEFESIKHPSKIKIYSNEKDWIINTETKLKNILEPYKTWKKALRSPLISTVSTILISLFIIKEFILLKEPSSYQTIDKFMFFVIGFITLIFVYFIQTLFIPRIKLKSSSNLREKASSVLKKQKENILISLGVSTLFFYWGIW